VDASSSDYPAVRLILSGDRLQDLRFVQALSEGSYPIHLAREHFWKLESLKEKFEIPLAVALGDELLLSDFEIVHERPLTRLGSIERPLIFPRAFFGYLKGLWSASRDLDYSFLGLMTPVRAEALNAWLERQGASQRIPHPFVLRVHRYLQKKMGWIGWSAKGITQFTFKTQHGSIMLGASDKGRVFPGKAWDDDYFRMLARSRFVLCPSGDFVWTYRFFESAMCGAIPIVEATCPSYEGFRYFTMDDRLEDLEWSADTAEHNFNACLERLTISREELDTEMSKLLGRA